ncbi:LLM class flavin-dependent oxidoreductase [Streptomyces sp. MUM 203J]|uniref:MupA/Atu3671 family FMN-dependent luciferase-like monooxygenase n=1 Tax=Streptomyces sp. MUM 203J TaxID=2791990 RepID=UPI001F0349E3|nr:MupA/Atu3671 family FMN-dependent luciferase-like monooxygenase [Streptomyces sp. MUM 203J]MCH0538345.1 LLM class flavin-dependent oxidoreductase [Streptomyces sp. MUM 203J]
MEFSLFYFADGAAPGGHRGRYDLLLDGARFADTHGFSAVWTPERHFHEFGGLYPNPSVTAAALAAVTERIGIRAGSVVAPLHHPVRIAEEWSVVDNLSHGRAGIALASGWNAVDFALRPEGYAGRKDAVVETVETVRSLWRGEPLAVTDGAGRPAEVKVFPPPVQPELPIWVTSAGGPQTFEAAGRAGAGVLTHLLGQDFDELAEKIARYRRALAERPGHDGRPGHVALMLHTCLGDDAAEVRETVREPFTAYLKSSFRLIARSATSILQGFDVDKLRESDIDFLVRRSFDTYYHSSGLFGTVEQATAVVERARAAGVDELACLIDFGIPDERVLSGLETLDELRQSVR